MPYLFQVSIGPVQSFIKGARRTRDLKFGSSFLSEIAGVAAQTLSQECGAESLIFPALTKQELEQPEESLDVPNKILAYIDSPPESVAEKVEKAIGKRIQQLWDDVRNRIASKTQFEHEQAQKQIDDLLEYTWAALEYDKNRPDPSYAQARQKLEALMAARKNTRDFASTEGSSTPKSSIDGQLECVIPKEAYPSNWSDVEKASGQERERRKSAYLDKVKALRLHFGAGPHEKLSGIDLLKRLGPIARATTDTTRKEEDTFPSASHMAALPFLQGLYRSSADKPEMANRWKNAYISVLKIAEKEASFTLDRLPRSYWEKPYWENIFPLDNYDGALLYPERFSDVVGDSQVFRDNGIQRHFQQATRLLENFCRDVRLHPNPYYALLVADGDSMGKVIDAQARKPDGMQRHKDLSEALAKFARQVREIVKEQAGVRIYSGGDDVLAMLPLHTAVACSRQLSQQFQEALKDFTDEQGHSPTLSVGLAVVHHLHPLGDALEIARAAEGYAKRGSKNALAITVQKRGGPPCTVGGRWGAFDQRLERLIKLCATGIIPSGMAYELEDIALRLEPDHEKPVEQTISPPYVQYAALRVFQRKLDEAKRRGHSEEEVASTLAQLKEMIGLDQIQPVFVGSLADELVVARLFADARRLAEGKSKGADEA